MRKLLRQISHANMKRQGIQHPNKRFMGTGKSGMPEKLPSFFSEHWREWAKKTPTRPINGVTDGRMI